MTRAEFDKECKVCTRPFTVFRWRAGTKGRYKKTEICQTCAKLKNVCQTCLLDLTFNLPVQVRDSALGITTTDIPKSDATREYMNKINEQKVAQGLLPYDHAAIDPAIFRMARNQPHYDRNRAHICSFFVKGTCNRGDACPFRHEMPSEEKSDLAQQNMKDRYYGVNDPVAKKMMQRVGESPAAPPEDTTIKTLYVGNVDSKISESDLKDYFYYFGEISSITMLAEQRCAFIEFTTREAAEAAISKLYNNLIVHGTFLRLAWAKPTQLGASKDELRAVNAGGLVGNRTYYPSMDPERLGARPDMPPPSSGPVQQKPNWGAAPTRPAEGSAEGEPEAKKQRT
eukprot:TRINITY_DN11288_c0_g1_i1.p1 TRINITY_DN11288_c0_g1~~TRINITY_DN11288_c0_g1_i1.p1  ORF type:complete len:373 (-),score=79.03 TRINITY_DN11288_c0_g1_i1:89-1111(-)